MSSAWVTAFEKEHLWMYLQALGFEPGPATQACGKVVSQTHLGVNMFDKLNRDAFQIVSYFLFQTLDQSLAKEVFKFCWPPFDQKSDTEFRKHCCEWLKKISAECGSSWPPVIGSLFLSPGGPKFIHLMYHFARYVAMKYIKNNSENSAHFIETFNLKPQDLHKCLARCHVARNRFLQVLQREDFVTQKYQENAQLSVKQVRNLRSQFIGLQNQVKDMEPCVDHSNLQEKIQKIRFLWASVNETLKILEKEREVVSSVLGLAKEYVLDGTDVAVNIPKLLLDNIEKQICKLYIGNVYEDGKLNLLTVIQLLNEALKVMKYEHCQADQARLAIDLHYLEKEAKFQRERLSDLKHMRNKINEDVTNIRHSVAEKQGEWHKKWTEFLGLSPFSLIKDGAAAVDLLPPMSPLSFDPASEEVYERSILSKYPALLPDTPKQQKQENDCRRDRDTLGPVHDLANSPACYLPQPASSLDKNSVILLEKDAMMKTPKEKNEMISKKMPEFEVEDSLLSDVAKSTGSSASGVSLPAKSDPFQKEQDRLVEEVARAVSSDSPQVSEGKEVKLEELIDALASNPFLTRKQIPRTPENLITEIRSSWRKAVEEVEENRTIEPVQMDIEHREGLSESSSMLQNESKISRGCFLSAAAVSNFGPSHLPENKGVSDCPSNVPQKYLETSWVFEPATQSQTDSLNLKVACEQNAEDTTLPTKVSENSQTEAFSPAASNRLDLMGSREEDYIKTMDHSKTSYEPFMHKTMLWNSFQISSEMNSRNLKDMDFGILHETLPEEIGHLSLNSSSSSEMNFKVEPHRTVHSDLFPADFLGERQSPPESDFSLQAISNSFEALKKSLSKQREESYLFNPETFERHKSEWSPNQKNVEADEMLDFLGTQDLHIDYSKPSLRMSVGERKRSLSPLIKFSPVEQRLRSTIPGSLGELLPNLKEESLGKSLGAEDSLLDWTR
ncbi:HAUS augmin-like complex subunit 6 isoform X1 [Ochotona curzoniae]|uniref:HAUS augmin-like complex subunit 6 isoform X1 n=2 Tax=Ochotona curzoniae TaxID=130825 RepID=UPI001B35391E|nr:HAUS augmin-like complex subunit 6 isoform X1 [Ochotona curzoniae]